MIQKKGVILLFALVFLLVMVVADTEVEEILNNAKRKYATFMDNEKIQELKAKDLAIQLPEIN